MQVSSTLEFDQRFGGSTVSIDVPRFESNGLVVESAFLSTNGQTIDEMPPMWWGHFPDGDYSEWQRKYNLTPLPGDVELDADRLHTLMVLVRPEPPVDQAVSELRLISMDYSINGREYVLWPETHGLFVVDDGPDFPDGMCDPEVSELFGIHPLFPGDGEIPGGLVTEPA